MTFQLPSGRHAGSSSVPVRYAACSRVVKNSDPDGSRVRAAALTRCHVPTFECNPTIGTRCRRWQEAGSPGSALGTDPKTGTGTDPRNGPFGRYPPPSPPPRQYL